MLEVFAEKLIATYLRGMQIEVHRKIPPNTSLQIYKNLQTELLSAQ